MADNRTAPPKGAAGTKGIIIAGMRTAAESAAARVSQKKTEGKRGTERAVQAEKGAAGRKIRKPSGRSQTGALPILLVLALAAYMNGNIVYLAHPEVWYTAEGGINALNLMLEDLEKELL